MKILLHGGDCCGVKHICELGYYPTFKLAARKPIKMTSFKQKQKGSPWTMSDGHNDMRSRNPKKNCDFFNEAAPPEMAKNRLNRLVKFIKNNRQHGLIEIVLSMSTQKAWIPVIEELGFKKGAEGKNSNTGVTIAVYHLVH